MIRVFSICLYLLFFSLPSNAERTPKNGVIDSRIKTVSYSENDVVDLTFHYGFQGLIEFSSNESVVNISIGDSIAWQVIPNKSGNLLFIKPVENQAVTNMTVVTNLRTYYFALTARIPNSRRDDDLAFRVKFVYAEDQASYLFSKYEKGAIPEGSDVSNLNFEYTFKGDNAVRPIRVLDDGKFTYFRFGPQLRVPAIFTVDDDGNESTVNFHKEGHYIIVHDVVSQFMLRDGAQSVCVFNMVSQPTSHSSLYEASANAVVEAD